MISIICPIYNEEKYIASCIQSMLNQDIPKENLEIFFIDGRSTDNTREIVESYSKKNPFIKLLDNPDKIVPPALNKAIKQAEGDYIIRIDAHCEYPTNYISTLLKYARELDCENIGAVCRTLPADSSTKSLAIAIGMSHKFGVGDSSFRVGSKGVRKVDTVPFGCFKRNIFDKIGLFDLDLTRNQDDEFNGRIIKNGGTIFLISDLVVDYYARDSFKKLFKMFYQYGLFKPLVNKKLGSPATIRQFFPLMFVLGIVLGGIMSFSIPYIYIPYCIVLSFYLILIMIIASKEALKYRRFGVLFYLPIVFFSMHISYGLGYLKGIYKVLFKKSFQVQTSR
ncbi:glycosyltransferase family 2 protein [Bacteroides coprosuis]|uniref:glycosyltransferase family 2 protein n=1 Tax=Bacteroides coprosuis TaxID=151276 RepID=UPI001E14F528|nr:glycosyltransferase family 2 protein [Bacteroides coprosuis]HJD92276.1 glycosyltransferase family 2 protein [Bacteroides coprosuis]